MYEYELTTCLSILCFVKVNENILQKATVLYVWYDEHKHTVNSTYMECLGLQRIPFDLL